MKIVVLFVILLCNLIIALPTGTAVFDPDYQEAAGLSWIIIEPILKFAMVGSIITLISCLIMAYIFDKEYQKAKTND